MTSGKSGAVCASLALAAHAALFMGMAAPSSQPGGHAGPVVTARYVVEVPAPSATPDPLAAADAAPTDPPAPAPAPAAVLADTPAAQDATDAAAPPDNLAPAFEEGGQPRIGFPDAPMPTQGAQVRAFVTLAPDGSLQEVAAAPSPGTTPPPGFQKSAERALKQARFTAGNGSAYCLLVSFEPDAPAPRLSWLPGAARDAARCLTGAMTTPRELAPAALP